MKQHTLFLRKQDICIGKQPVWEALQAGRQIERIYLSRSMSGDVIGSICKVADEQGIPLNRVPKERINRLTNLNHQGILAVLSPVRYYKLEDVVDQCYRDGRDPLILILDGVTDVGNFGAVCRTALGMDVDAVVIGYRHSAPVNEHAIKASAGALHHLKVCRDADLRDTLRYCSNMGIRSLAMDGQANRFIHQADLTGPLAIVMGSEDKGVHPDVLELVDEPVKLYAADALESYNVSVAAALALYEVRRVQFPA